MGEVNLNLARLICAFILHMSIMPEINCAINLMRFIRNNPQAFYGHYSFFPFLIALMKLTAGLLTEITNILIITKSINIENCIKDFIAFGFICEIDDLMIQTVKEIDCEEEITRAGISFPKK